MTGGADLAWRWAIAERIAAAYGPAPRLAVLAVAGSVGTGWADRWSDLELDCYWLDPPTDDQRRAPVEQVGGRIEAFWEYDETDREWSEDYRVDGLGVTVSNFTVATMDEFLRDVVEEADTDRVKHYRLAAVQRARPVRGSSQLAAWRQKAAGFPDRLVAALVTEALAPEILAGWAAREVLAERGDTAALHALLSHIEQSVLGALLALNRTYRPHRILKWQRRMVDELSVAPAGLAQLLADLWAPSWEIALGAAERLLLDTADLAERHAPVQLGELRQAVAERRRPLDPPAPLS
ncbi:MAG TPA: DUF4037 domain-containing protein [Acidimicrobiales bacterium]|nr:DUF4037 domain-containing protein [Acidimicrobiales bacterium]